MVTICLLLDPTAVASHLSSEFLVAFGLYMEAPSTSPPFTPSFTFLNAHIYLEALSDSRSFTPTPSDRCALVALPIQTSLSISRSSASSISPDYTMKAGMLKLSGAMFFLAVFNSV